MIRRFVVIAAASLALAGTAQAAPIAFAFDFIAAARNNEFGAQVMTFTDNGVTLRASGSATNDDDPIQYAYLDDLSGGRPAGLGVCKDLTSSRQCTPSSDDNVTAGETLSLLFDREVTLSQLGFRNADHLASYPSGAKIDIGIDGRFASYALTPSFTQALTGTRFDFRNSGAPKDQFYISGLGGSYMGGGTDVPAPPAMALFAAAAGAIVIRRRRRA